MSVENNEERNVSEDMRKERFASMERVMTQLYCRHVFHDFRKPVEVMYPHLTETYHSLVKRPMDLGTLLLKTIKKEILTIEEFRTNLQLVHNNALLFNEGAPLMEAISNHLRLFSQGLFEEVMRFPYFTPKTLKPANFQSARLEKRRKRFMLIRDQTLINSELENLLDIFDDESGSVPPTIQQAYDDARAIIVERLAWNKAADTSDLDLSTDPCGLSLRSLLSQLILTATQAGPQTPSSKSLLVDCFCDAQSEEKQAYGEFRLPRTEASPFLAVLEERFGELSVLLEERLLRGTPASSIWATPASMYVYAQSISSTATSSEGRSRSPWWPCQIIATDASTCAAFMASPGATNGTSNALGMRAEVQRANLARIPADILKGLNKLKPRTANVVAAMAGEGEVNGNGEGRADSAVLESPTGTKVVSAHAQFVVPEGYLLLEYFGEHDFGWVKAESVTAMYTYTPTADGSVYISKNEAPGRLCHKDVVAEAAEAWSTLQKQRRRDGLYRRSLLPPPSFLPESAGGVMEASADGRSSSAMSVATDGAHSNAEDEGISFAPTASLTARSSLQGSSAASEYLSQDSDTDGADHQDLSAPPSLSELEESVDIPFSSTLFEHGQMGGMSGGEMGLNGSGGSNASSAAKSSSSRPSNGRARKSLSANADGDNYFDDTSVGAASGNNAFCIPGPRKGNFIPVGSAAHNGTYNQGFDWEDKRIMYASPEEMLQYRANVEYVLLEDVTLEDFKNCVVEGKFKPSRCPLPLPTLQSEPSSPIKTAPSAPKEVKEELIVVDPATQATFRPKALLRTRALAYFLSGLRPLHLEHYTATPSKKGFPAVTGGGRGLKVTAAGDAGSSADAAALLANEDAPLLLASVEDKKGSNGKAANGDAIALPAKPEKRKYVFKNKPAKAAAVAVASPSQEVPSEQTAGEPAAAVAVTTASSSSSSATTAPTAPAPATTTVTAAASASQAITLPPISAASIHVPANLTLSSSCFLLDAGCSRFATGDGSVYTRAVNTDAKVFHLEAKTCKDRKRILREELSALQAAIDALQQVSQQRQLRENERKIRFQQLQQQQLQQQLHQQQYAVQVQQQHQQYLMQLIQQQQQQQQQLQNRVPHPAGGAAGAALKKGLPSKPKGVKLMINTVQNGVPVPPKPRSRPLVVFNAAGQPTIVRSSVAPSTAGAASPAASVTGEVMPSDAAEATAGAVPSLAQYTIPAPRKKSRLGDIDLSKATILTAQQHAAEQPKHPQKRAKVKLALPAKATSSTSGGSSSSSNGAEDSALLGVHHLSTPPALAAASSSSASASATHGLDFLASVAMESNEAPVRSSLHGDDLLGYKRSFGSISSPPAPMDVTSPDLAESNSRALSSEAMTY